MNIFVLDRSARVSASYLHDRHVIKMILEHTQMLSSAVSVNKEVPGVYKTTHLNHPCSVWVRKSQENFLWLMDYTTCLLDIYKAKSNKTHASAKVANICLEHIDNIPKGARTEHPACMPEVYKEMSNDVVRQYLHYYTAEKLKNNRYTYNKLPVEFASYYT